MKKKVKRFCKVFACALSIMVVMVLGFAVSADETVTDLTGTTWRWNYEDIPVFTGASDTGTTKHIDFSSNNETFQSLTFYNNSGYRSIDLPGLPYSIWFYNVSTGQTTRAQESYQEFTITGGSDVTNVQLITWITANATQVIPQPSIWDNIGTFLSSCVAWLGSVVTYITGNEVLTIFVIGIAVISFSIGALRRLLNTRG